MSAVAAVRSVMSAAGAERRVLGARRLDRRIHFIQTLGSLRASEEGWGKVCDSLETWSNRDSGFEFWVSMAAQQLDRWPDALRALPTRWVWTLLRGETYPGWLQKLARGLRIEEPSCGGIMDPVWGQRVAQSPAAGSDGMRWLHLSGPTTLGVEVLSGLLVPGRWEALRALTLEGGTLSAAACAALGLWLSRHDGLQSLNLSGVSLHTNTLKRLIEDGVLGSVERLVLRDNHLDDEAILALSAALSGVASAEAHRGLCLDVSGNPIGNKGFEALQRLAAARPSVRISMGAGCLDRRGVQAWLSLGWRRPETLDLSRQVLPSEGLGELLGQVQLGCTKALDLSATATRGLALRQWVKAPWVCGGLEQLALRSNGLNAGTLWPTAALERLQALDLSCNPLRRGGLSVLARWALPGLKSLCVSRAQLCDEAALALSQAAWFGQLRGLDVSFNQIGAQGVRAVLGASSRLERLVLRGNPLGDEGVLVISAACARGESLRSLTALDLSRCGASAEAMLGVLEQPNVLQHLSIRGAPLSASCMQSLAFSPFLAHLQRLDADWHTLSPGCLQPLIQNPWINEALRAFLLTVQTTVAPLPEVAA